MDVFERPNGLKAENFEPVGLHLARKRILFLRGPISPMPYRWDAYGPSAIGDMIMAMACQDAEKPIWVIIDSPGGDVETGFALYDVMRLVPTPIHTVGQSSASMASVLLAAGKKGHRYLLPNARTMIHLPSGSIEGNSEDLENSTTQVKIIKDNLVKAYIDCGATKTAIQINRDLRKDFWMNPEQTINYGLADKVMDSATFAAMLKGETPSSE